MKEKQDTGLLELMRYLVERLPAMVTPRWVQSRNQPIAIRNVIAYLIGCLEHEETVGQTFDIGGPDILTYLELLNIYADSGFFSVCLNLSPKKSANRFHRGRSDLHQNFIIHVFYPLIEPKRKLYRRCDTRHSSLHPAVQNAWTINSSCANKREVK